MNLSLELGVYMIESVEIKNYKIIDYLKVENLTNINFFVGKNNCGKTSLLEAIFLNLEPSNPQVIVGTISNYIRQIMVNRDNLSWLFYKMDTKKHIEIISVYDSKTMSVKIRPKIPNDFAQLIPNETQEKINKTISNNVSNDRVVFGLVFESKFNGKNEVKSSFDIKGNDITSMAQSEYQTFSGLFISSNISSINTARIVAQIRIAKKEQMFNEYLRLFDETILSVEVIGSETMIDIQEMPQKANINIMGEGFRKYLLIVGSLILEKYNYICIDEIENGLHFESMKKLIKSIVKLSKEAKIQLFISTHSYEFLEILNNIALETKFNNIAVFNLKQANEDLQTRRYNMADLKHLLNAEIEFRK